MIFNTVAYFLLFLVPAAILFRIVRSAAQPWVCVGFGAAFFIFFSLTQVGGVPGAVCLLIFIWESIFSRFYKQGSVLCLIGIAQTILFLIAFKYWNFLTALVFAPAKYNPLFWPGAFLPLGVSFFTFEFIHYAVDRYRGKTPAGSFGQYLAFILFFPTMVAGPIKRYEDFRPKLLAPSRAWLADWQQGLTRILAGLVKKFMVADLLTAFTGHLNRADVAQAQRWVLPIWLLAYGIKIYFDFSAYSDIAIGSARLFGIKVPENFDWPYLRTNIAEFWKHWHMSLYNWLVEYVFIPLGGSRTTQPRVYFNVLITMLLSGLWHGAGLNFVVWGLWHGLLLSGYRFWSNWRRANARRLMVPRQELSWLAGALNAAHNLIWRPLQPAPILLRAETVVNRAKGRASGIMQVAGADGTASTSKISALGREPLSMNLKGPEDQSPGRLEEPPLPYPSLPGEEREKDAAAATWIGKLGGWALTFALVNLGWAFFCMDLPTSLFFLRRLFFG